MSTLQKRVPIYSTRKTMDKKSGQKFNCAIPFPSRPKYTVCYERYLSTEIKTGHLTCTNTYERTLAHSDTVRFRTRPLKVSCYLMQNNLINSKCTLEKKKKRSFLVLTQNQFAYIEPAENLDSFTALIINSNDKNARS